jgi:drug/metabolite transporter (DMT)-like permease
MFISGIIYLIPAAIVEGTQWKNLLSEWRWNLKIVLFASFYRGIGLGLYFLGLSLTTPINAAVLQVTIPVFVVIFCIAFRGEAKSVFKIAGVVVAIGFSIGLIAVENYSSASIGDVIIIIMGLSFAGWLTWVGPFTQHFPAFTFNSATFITASFMFGPFMVLQRSRLVSPINFSLDLWVSLIIMVLLGTVAFQILEYWVVVNSSPVLASAYSPMQMVFTILLEWTLRSNVPTIRQGACSVGVVIGLALVSWVKWRENEVLRAEAAAKKQDESKSEELVALNSGTQSEKKTKEDV